MPNDDPISVDSREPISPGSIIRGWLELVRLPNVFTAAADVLMGFLFMHDSLDNRQLVVALLTASCALYLAGMVLNDVFDFSVDSLERPGRPLPSGRVPLGAAKALGALLLVGGLAAGWSASHLAGGLRSGLVATLLATMVLLYDRWLKHTTLGPLAMGSCRMLNVLLGMSATALPWHTIHWMVALGIGTYVVGVTWFARTEAEESNRWQLGLAVAVMACGIGLLAWFPNWATLELDPVSQPVHINDRWPLLWGLLAVFICMRPVIAIISPSPQHVQAAVKNSILSLIMLDAVACYAVRGQEAALLIVFLLFPAMFLGRWIYST